MHYKIIFKIIDCTTIQLISYSWCLGTKLLLIKINCNKTGIFILFHVYLLVPNTSKSAERASDNGRKNWARRTYSLRILPGLSPSTYFHGSMSKCSFEYVVCTSNTDLEVRPPQRPLIPVFDQFKTKQSKQKLVGLHFIQAQTYLGQNVQIQAHIKTLTASFCKQFVEIAYYYY